MEAVEETFSIRGYVLKMRSLDPRRNWPFQEDACNEEIESLLPPIVCPTKKRSVDEPPVCLQKEINPSMVISLKENDFPEENQMEEERQGKTRKPAALEPVMKICPVCDAFSATSVKVLNAHINRCLSKASKAEKKRSLDRSAKFPRKRSIVELFAKSPEVQPSDEDYGANEERAPNTAVTEITTFRSEKKRRKRRKNLTDKPEEEISKKTPSQEIAGSMKTTDHLAASMSQVSQKKKLRNKKGCFKNKFFYSYSSSKMGTLIGGDKHTVSLHSILKNRDNVLSSLKPKLVSVQCARFMNHSKRRVRFSGMDDIIWPTGKLTSAKNSEQQKPSVSSSYMLEEQMQVQQTSPESMTCQERSNCAAKNSDSGVGLCTTDESKQAVSNAEPTSQTQPSECVDLNKALEYQEKDNPLNSLILPSSQCCNSLDPPRSTIPVHSTNRAGHHYNDTEKTLPLQENHLARSLLGSCTTNRSGDISNGSSEPITRTETLKECPPFASFNAHLMRQICPRKCSLDTHHSCFLQHMPVNQLKSFDYTNNGIFLQPNVHSTSKNKQAEGNATVPSLMPFYQTWCYHDDFVGLPLNSKGEYIQPSSNSNLNRYYNRQYGDIDYASAVQDYPSSHQDGKHDQYGKEKVMHIPCPERNNSSSSLPSGQSIYNGEAQAPVAPFCKALGLNKSDHIFEEQNEMPEYAHTERSTKDGQSNKSGQRLQPTMRLMGKNVTVACSSMEEPITQNGKIWIDKETIAEDCSPVKYSSQDFSPVEYIPLAFSSGKSRECLTLQGQIIDIPTRPPVEIDCCNLLHTNHNPSINQMPRGTTSSTSSPEADGHPVSYFLSQPALSTTHTNNVVHIEKPLPIVCSEKSHQPSFCQMTCQNHEPTAAANIPGGHLLRNHSLSMPNSSCAQALQKPHTEHTNEFYSAAFVPFHPPSRNVSASVFLAQHKPSAYKSCTLDFPTHRNLPHPTIKNSMLLTADDDSIKSACPFGTPKPACTHHAFTSNYSPLWNTCLKSNQYEYSFARTEERPHHSNQVHSNTLQEDQSQLQTRGDPGALGLGSLEHYTQRFGPVKLRAGSKHILRPATTLNRESVPTHSTIPLSAATLSGTMPVSRGKTANVYMF